MKNLLRLAAVGALVGGLATSWLAPKAIAWYFTPPIDMPINCKIPIEWALHKLQIAQLVGTILGGVSFTILGSLLLKNKSQETAL